MGKFLKIDQQGAAVIVVIDRPPVNALNNDLLDELIETFYLLSQKRENRVIILTGAGTKAFVAGADLKEIRNCGQQEGEALSRKCHSLLKLLRSMQQPIICAVNGLALGGGCELALYCDLRVASSEAQFGLPEVGLGLLPGAGGTQLLARLIGVGLAMEIMLTGKPISAQEAYRNGLINRIAEPGKELEEALQMAEVIASRSPVAAGLIKQAVTLGLDHSLSTGLELETKLFGQVCASKDKEEGVEAFLAKRSPIFPGY